MADSFDPYHKWLGISPKDQPPNHYRLLAIELFENDLDVIEGAADRQMAHVRTFQAGQNSAASQRILNELSAAKLCLLDPAKKAAYDRQLREKIERAQAAAATSSGVIAPAAATGAPPAAAPARPVPISAAPAPLAMPLRQSGGVPPAQAAPIVGVPAAAPLIHPRRSRKTSPWRQPAVLGPVGALVLFSAVAYFLSVSGKLPTVVAKNPRNESRSTDKRNEFRSTDEASSRAPTPTPRTDRAVPATPNLSTGAPVDAKASAEPTKKPAARQPGTETDDTPFPAMRVEQPSGATGEAASALAGGSAQASGLHKVFEDERAFVAALTQGNGQAMLATDESYSGKASIMVTGVQRFGEAMPGLRVKIRKNPNGPDEYRYLQFAWKKLGGREICLQLHYPSNWFNYSAGPASGFTPAIKVDSRRRAAQLGTVPLAGVSSNLRADRRRGSDRRQRHRRNRRRVLRANRGVADRQDERYEVANDVAPLGLGLGFHARAGSMAHPAVRDQPAFTHGVCRRRAGPDRNLANTAAIQSRPGVVSGE